MFQCTYQRKFGRFSKRQDYIRPLVDHGDTFISHCTLHTICNTVWYPESHGPRKVFNDLRLKIQLLRHSFGQGILDGMIHWPVHFNPTLIFSLDKSFDKLCRRTNKCSIPVQIRRCFQATGSVSKSSIYVLSTHIFPSHVFRLDTKGSLSNLLDERILQIVSMFTCT